MFFSASDSKGRTFKSCQARQESPKTLRFWAFMLLLESLLSDRSSLGNGCIIVIAYT